MKTAMQIAIQAIAIMMSLVVNGFSMMTPRVYPTCQRYRVTDTPIIPSVPIQQILLTLFDTDAGHVDPRPGGMVGTRSNLQTSRQRLDV
jgi:hypothetical protein